MFGKLPLLINDDWVNGNVFNDVLVEPVRAARNVLKGSDHESLKRTWESIEYGFDEWKEQQTQLPVKNPLEVNSAIDYEAARALFFEHVAEGSPKKLPIIYAVLTLEAASRDDTDTANKAFQQLNKYSQMIEMKAVGDNYLRAANYIDNLTAKLQPFKEGRSKGGQKGSRTDPELKQKVLSKAKELLDDGKNYKNVPTIIKNWLALEDQGSIKLSRYTIKKYTDKAIEENKLKLK